MPGKSATFENDVLKLIFNGTAIANVADNTATSPLTNLFVALHTADPTDAGTQSSNEVTTAQMTNYARQSVARTSGGWAVSGSSVTPVAAITFPSSSGGTGATVTHWSIGVAASGATKILYSGTVSPNIVISTGVAPQLGTGSTVTEG